MYQCMCYGVGMCDALLALGKPKQVKTASCLCLIYVLFYLNQCNKRNIHVDSCSIRRWQVTLKKEKVFIKYAFFFDFDKYIELL